MQSYKSVSLMGWGMMIILCRKEIKTWQFSMEEKKDSTAATKLFVNIINTHSFK